MKTMTLILLLVVCALPLYPQNITNTLGTSGLFTIKDASNNYLTVSQSTGQVNILRTLRLENTTSSSLGILFKGTDRFLHNYTAPGTNGYNTFLGMNSGNLTMSGTGGQSSYNTGIGYNSLQSLTTGSENTAVGYSTLIANTTGYNNTAVGLSSLFSNTTGYNNTALGAHSLRLNTTGMDNTAVGLSSLSSNTTGSSNTALGNSSLYSNTTGYDNTAVGKASLFLNTTGCHNTAVGRESLIQNNGTYNTSVGYQSLFSNTTGCDNTALGVYSLNYNTTGDHNTALGKESLKDNTTGYYNTAVGSNAGGSLTTGKNNTFIGFGAWPSAGNVSNQITLGNYDVTSLRCQVTSITSLSDARDKKNIHDLSLGIDFLMKLKPRLFNWDKREWYKNNKSDGSKMQKTLTAGFIAQELDEVQTKENAEWLNLVLKSNPEKLEATPGNLLPVMVKAIQELEQKLLKYEQTQNDLVNEIQKLKSIKEK